MSSSGVVSKPKHKKKPDTKCAQYQSLARGSGSGSPCSGTCGATRPNLRKPVSMNEKVLSLGCNGLDPILNKILREYGSILEK